MRIKRVLSMLLALALALSLTGCGDGNSANEQPTPSVSPEGEAEPTAQPTAGATDPQPEAEFMSEEKLADTRWVAVREKGTLYTGEPFEYEIEGMGYELFLFEDGTAQWLWIDNADRRPLSDPYGFWTLSGDRLTFFGEGDNAGEEARFRAEDGALVWERGESLEVWLEPAEMEGWLTPLAPQDLTGVWQLEFMTADGCDYGADELFFDSVMCIGADAEGSPVVDSYYSTEFDEARLRDRALPVLWDERPAASGWAPWVAELSTGKSVERSLIYMGSPDLLYVEDFYYMDGAPAVALYRYRRVPERFGYITLTEEGVGSDLIRLNVEEMLWVTPDDEELIERYGLAGDLDGYDYELIPIGETVCTALKDSTVFYLLNDELVAEGCGWEDFAARLLQGGIDAHYCAVPSDSGERMLLIKEVYVP